MCGRLLQALSLLSVLLLAACSQTSIASPLRAPASGAALPKAPLSVYLGSRDGTVSALDATSGIERWRVVVADASTTTVSALADGVLYVIATSARTASPSTTLLTALRASDGAMLWHKALAGAGPSRASAYHGTIYITAYTTLLPSPGYFYASTLLYALNASTGTVSWHRQIARTNYVAAVADGKVYLVDTGTDLVSDPKALHVLSASDGMDRWQAGGTLLHLIGVEQGRAYVTDVPDRNSAATYEHVALRALNADDGSSAWQLDLQSKVDSGRLANGVLYLPAEGTALAAYKATNGAVLWHVQGESGWLWFLDGVLYTSVLGQGIDALDPATGARRWHYRTGDTASLSTVAHGTLYAVSSHLNTGSSGSQEVIALSAHDGKLLWHFPLGPSADVPVVG